MKRFLLVLCLSLLLDASTAPSLASPDMAGDSKNVKSTPKMIDPTWAPNYPVIFPSPRRPIILVMKVPPPLDENTVEKRWKPFNCDKVKKTGFSEVACLACNINHEARNQSEKGKAAVAYVTINRAISRYFPKTICDVVWEIRVHYITHRPTAMFSWTLDKYTNLAIEQNPWYESLRIAYQIYNDWIEYGEELVDPITKGSMWYHADYVHPSWASNTERLRKVTVIGSHIFYATATN